VQRLDADLRAVMGEKAEAEEGWLQLATSEGDE
jgi:hypothetical protein